MKSTMILLLAVLMLTGCAAPVPEPSATPSEAPILPSVPEASPPQSSEVPDSTHSSAAEYDSRFSRETIITLSDAGITVDGGAETDTVYTSHDIIYYQDRDTYDSGNPYGEGLPRDRHSAAEAETHTVVNITSPGAYRIRGRLSRGQIWVDLGKKSRKDPEKVVELILEDADITCTVAPAIVFYRVYECDAARKEEDAVPFADTSAAGASLVLAGESRISGSHVARIFKDKEGKKKLWKQDGAIYSYASMNIYGPGSLSIRADEEGIGTERHLTIHGGALTIRADNDGINANNTNISVITINAGQLHVLGGLQDGGDGIDSNGYLVINGGTIVAAAHLTRDGGLDSTLGTMIHGGQILSLATIIDWAHDASSQPTMNLRFADINPANTMLVITGADGAVVWAYDPALDSILGSDARPFGGAVVSSPALEKGKTYALWTGGRITGTVSNGMYDPATVTAYEGGTRLMYTGTFVSHDFSEDAPGNSGRTDCIMTQTVSSFTGLTPARP